MKKEENLTRRTFKGTLYLISSGGIQVALKIAVLAVLARFVTPTEFGLMGIALVILEFSKFLSQMGIGPCIVQRKELETRHLTTGFSISLAIGILFSILLWTSAPFWEKFFRMEGLVEILRVITVVFLINSITLMGLALLQRNMNFKLIAIIEVTSYALGYGAVGIALGVLNYGVWSLVFANIAQALVAAVLYMIYQPFPKRLGIDKKAFRELMYFGFGFTIAKIGNFLATQGDNIVVGRTLGAGALGIYGRAHNFMVMPSSLFGNALDRSLFPAMAKVQGDKSKLANAFLTGISMIALIAIPISVSFVILAPEFILILLGNNWVAVIFPFQILAASLLFRMSYKMSDSLARATNAVYRRAWRQIIYALAVFLGSYIGQFWGLGGVAAGVSAALIINFLLMAKLSIQITGISWGDLLKAHLNGFQLGIVTTICCLLLATVFRKAGLPHLLTLTGTLSGAGLLILVVLWMFPRHFIRQDQQLLINKLVLKPFKKAIVQAA